MYVCLCVCVWVKCIVIHSNAYFVDKLQKGHSHRQNGSFEISIDAQLYFPHLNKMHKNSFINKSHQNV